jgi:organic hydroperoxide reductase OsmC/OhrA
MPYPFAHIYKVNLSNINYGLAEISSENAPKISGGAPPQFGGVDIHWSPENLLLSAIGLCFVTTLTSIQKKHKGLELIISNLNLEAKLDKTKEGLVFTDITLNVICTSNEIDKATRLLETAKKYCLISNAIKTPTKLNLTIKSNLVRG